MKFLVIQSAISRATISLLVLLMSVTLLLEAPAVAQEPLERNSGETLKAFAERVIPKDHALAHKVVVGTFGPSANNIVILFRPPDYKAYPDLPTFFGHAPYIGWVLIPDKEKAGIYRKAVLPPMVEEARYFDVAVDAVFCAQADKDRELELIVLYTATRRRVPPESHHEVYVYDWDGKSFVLLEKVEEKLSGLKSAAVVRRKLMTLKK